MERRLLACYENLGPGSSLMLLAIVELERMRKNQKMSKAVDVIYLPDPVPVPVSVPVPLPESTPVALPQASGSTKQIFQLL